MGNSSFASTQTKALRQGMTTSSLLTHLLQRQAAATQNYLELKATAAISHLSPHSFFIMSSTFLARSDGFSCASPLAANFATYISANCFRVKAQPCRPEPKPTVPSTGSI